MAASEHLNPEQFGIEGVSEFTKSTQDKTYARRKTTQWLKEKSGETITAPSNSGTSQRVLDAWRKKQGA